ncbi:MAG: hypothetical protein DMG57_08960 [Acidobacteria bacterium]|nr:MAG: hypothetical protein DMG57_08960 [Acidobacteriota bacterium]
MDFPIGSDVFTLPDGRTANAPSMFIFNNRFLPPASSVPEPSGLLAARIGAGITGVGRRMLVALEGWPTSRESVLRLESVYPASRRGRRGRCDIVNDHLLAGHSVGLRLTFETGGFRETPRVCRIYAGSGLSAGKGARADP